MSDYIEVGGRKYFEESYLELANGNAKRIRAERDQLREQLAAVTAERDAQLEAWKNMSVTAMGLSDEADSITEKLGREVTKLRDERDALARVVKVCRNTAERVMDSQTSGPVKDIMANLLLDTGDINPDVILAARDQRVRREALEEAAKRIERGMDPPNPLLKPNYNTGPTIIAQLRRMAESPKP